MGQCLGKLPGDSASQFSMGKARNSKLSSASSAASELEVNVKVEYDDVAEDKAVDRLQAEKILNRALSAKRRGDIFDYSTELNENVAEEFAKPKVKKSSHVHDLLLAAMQKNILFRGLVDDQMELIVNSLSKKSVKEGSELITQGEKGDFFYIVESGSFSVYVNGEKKGECNEKSTFGELALLYNCPRAATVKSNVSSKVWCLERTTFRSIIASTADKKQAEIKKALKKVSLLKSLRDDQISKISDAVERAHFNEGETIIRKGDKGGLFYMITRGSVQCTKVGRGTSTTNDVELGKGDYFGERALLKSEPRAANVIAMEETDCLVLDKESFNSLLGDLKDIMSINLGHRIISSIGIFSQLSAAEKKKLLKALQEETYAKGTTIIKQGDKGTKFFLISEGMVMVTKEVDGVEKPASVAELKMGEYFGEASLLNDEPRSCNVTAASDTVTCLTMERKAFEKLLGPLQTIMKREVDNREDELELAVKKQEKIVEDSLTLTDLKQLKTLGTGTFGRVKLVECPKLKRTYALKILQKAQIVAYRQQTNVMNEKDILLSCDHPFILRLYKTFKDKSCLYLLLELVLGGELFTLLHIRGGRLAESDSKFYAACVVDALGYLHERKIVYRDLKPENLMIADDGYIKVVDFGFAKKVEDKTFTLCGTPEYLAPELILAKGHNHAVDNWGVGILIFEMLTGGTPFADHENNDHMKICKQIVRLKVDWPKKFPERAKDLVTKLLTREPHMRLGSLKNGVDDIKHHPWFKSIDYNELVRRRIKAPWLPPIKNSLDTSNFDEYDEDDTVEPYRSHGSNWDKNF